ncbi:MAG: putative quinol monooxygenase [Methyloligellaceae bacterium]
MSGPLTIVARIVPKPGVEDELETAMKDLIAATRQEPGCILYDLHRSSEGPCIFVFYETWESKPLWEAHMAGAAIQAFREAANHMIESGEVLQMSRVA